VENEGSLSYAGSTDGLYRPESPAWENQVAIKTAVPLFEFAYCRVSIAVFYAYLKGCEKAKACYKT